MVKMQLVYEGGFHCEITHDPSQSQISTDAPKDNMGKGEAFSPTDLVGAALGSCIITTVAIRFKNENWKLEGSKVEVLKEMVSDPRRIGALHLKITLPSSIPTHQRSAVEAVAHDCPVAKSLHPDLKIPVEFLYN